MTTFDLKDAVVWDAAQGCAEIVATHAALSRAGLADSDPEHALQNIRRLRLSYSIPNERSPTFLPDRLFTPTFAHITELWLQNVPLKALPTAIGNCKQLQVLHAQGCGLSSLPVRLAECKRLRVLRLSRNMLRELPQWIGYLRSLEALWLDTNKLVFLPPELGALKALKQLKLAGNPSLRLPAGCIEDYSASFVSKDTQLRGMQAEVVVHHLFALLYWSPAQHRMFHGAAGATMPLTAILLAASRAAGLDLLPLLPAEIWWEIFRFINGDDFSKANTAKAMEETIFEGSKDKSGGGV